MAGLRAAGDVEGAAAGPLEGLGAWAVARLSCSKDVQVELLRSEQLPEEDQVMPTWRNIEVAVA